MIRITKMQFHAIEDLIDDINFLDIEEGNGGNIVVYFDGDREENICVTEKGSIL